ncbi:MAG: MFS transporter [Bryobacteraceae bacterium]
MKSRTWIVVGLLCVANIIAYIDRINLSTALADEAFKAYFGLTNALRGDLNSAFFWSYAFLQIPAGALTDRYGVKYPLAIGFVAWSLVSAATGWADTLWQLFALRLLLGVGEAVITPGAMRWIRYHIEEKRRGFVVGIFFAGAKVGPAVGSSLAAWLLVAHGWRNMFIFLGVGCMLWVVPWLYFARDDDRELEAAQKKQVPGPSVPFSAVFATPAIWGIIIGTFAYNYFNYFCLTWLPAYFRDHWKVSMQDMGLFTTFSFLGMAITAVCAGAVADWIIARGADAVTVRKAFTVAGLAIASTEVLGVMSGSKDVALAFSIISMAGLGLTTANYWALTQSLMPGAAIGRIAGVQNFASNLSGIVAPIVTGRLIAMTGSYEAPMQAIVIILAIGIAAYVFLVKKKYAPRTVAA